MSALDNLTANISKVAFTTLFDAEKVVKTFTGNFAYGTSTTTINYTLSGFPNATQQYVFPHGFTRPVFIELLWSIDNVYYVVGGSDFDAGSNYAIGYSDSTNIYIMTTPLAAGTTVYYKVICTWIPDYDTTNPSINSFQEIPSNFTQVFNSRAFIPPVVKNGVISSSTGSGTFTDVVTTVDHNLGYSPNFKAFIESFSGQVWPLNHGGSANPYLVDDNQVEAQAFTTTNQFISDMILKSASGTRRMWYLIYGQNSDYKGAVYNFTQV